MTAVVVSRDLQTFARWCRKQANQPNADPLWSVLAREVEAYMAGDPSVIATRSDPLDQETLL